MNKQQLQDEYKTLIREKRFVDLDRLIQKTTIKPAEYSVRIGVKTYLGEKRSLKTKLFFIIKLLEITETNLDANIIQDICKLMLELGNPYTLEFFAKKTSIDEAIYKEIKGYIQKHYSTYINEGKLVEITKLMEISKIEPSESLIFEGYKNYLQEGNIISYVNLQKRTEIEPKKEFILEMFQFYKNKSDISPKENEDKGEGFWEKRIEKLSKVTGIEFNPH